MITNKYATLRGTIARAKRNDCQKVVMRVTLVEELLLQLSNAEKQVAALAAEVQAVRWAAGQFIQLGIIMGTLILLMNSPMHLMKNFFREEMKSLTSSPTQTIQAM